MEKIYGIHPEILPYQNISFYEEINSNKYDYVAQLDVLFSSPDIVIAPIKVFLEKFPNKDFYKKNSIEIKKGDSIDTSKIAEEFIKLGYKRSTMVSDIGEFSIRGDIIDIYSLDKNPVRIELWGDEVVDIRYFNNETQKSVEKIKEVSIRPLYKFIASEKLPFKFDEEGYFILAKGTDEWGKAGSNGGIVTIDAVDLTSSNLNVGVDEISSVNGI